MSQVRWPTNEHRVLVVGRTGSGKTVGGLWLLSTRNFHEQPWIIIDYKRDQLVEAIHRAGAVMLHDFRNSRSQGIPLPREPGLYIIRPDPKDYDAMNDWLQQVWERENIGLFCDEGFMIPQRRPYKSYDNLLTTGRSMNLPMIMLYQRPIDMSTYATSQADFIMAYHILKPEDRAKLNEYVGTVSTPEGEVSVMTPLPKYYSLWYDVAEDRATVLRPTPPPDAVLATFRSRLQPDLPPVPETSADGSIQGVRFV